MNPEQVQQHLRGSDAEQVLLLAYAEGGTVTPPAVKRVMDDEPAADAAAQELRDLGLAQSDISAVQEVTLTGNGKSVAERIQRSRLDGPYRRAEVQRGILKWLKENPHALSTEDYVSTETATAWGVPFADEEVAVETSWLHENELVKGTPTWEAGWHVLKSRMMAVTRWTILGRPPSSFEEEVDR